MCAGLHASSLARRLLSHARSRLRPGAVRVVLPVHLVSDSSSYVLIAVSSPARGSVCRNAVWDAQSAETVLVVVPGVAAALVTTVAGLLVAIPSMFGYNWLVHNLRVQTVELDNFAQELASKLETEFLKDE
mgnify:CR=1 FL=1